MHLWCEWRLSSSQNEEEKEEEEAFPEFVAEEVESDYSDLEVGSVQAHWGRATEGDECCFCCAGYVNGS